MFDRVLSTLWFPYLFRAKKRHSKQNFAISQNLACVEFLPLLTNFDTFALPKKFLSKKFQKFHDQRNSTTLREKRPKSEFFRYVFSPNSRKYGPEKLRK